MHQNPRPGQEEFRGAMTARTLIEYCLARLQAERRHIIETGQEAPIAASQGRHLQTVGDLHLYEFMVPAGVSMQITAEFPDGSIEPLLWLKDYKDVFAHPFLLRKPLALPAGTVIRGVPAGASVSLLPVR